MYHCFVIFVPKQMDDVENSNPELIYLTDGASKGVMQMLNTVIRNDKDGVWWICLNLKTNLVCEREIICFFY